MEKDKVQLFKRLLHAYFKDDQASRLGLPRAIYFAEQLLCDPGYFETFFKDQTGIPVQDYIDQQLIIEAKKMLFKTEYSINYIAAALGFKNQNHFTLFFKRGTGVTPHSYKEIIISNFKDH